MRKWKLKSEDFWMAKRYLERRLSSSTYLEHLSLDKAIQDFRESARNATMLQEWIEKYLQKEQIEKLRVFLRVEKSRRKKSLQTITIESATRARLADYANSHNVTLSEAIDILLDNAESSSVF